MARKGSSFSAPKSSVAAYIATVIISPCAKLTTRTTPKITDRPSAIKPYTRPVRTPAMTTFATRSKDTQSGGLLRPPLRLLVPRNREHRLGCGRRLRQDHGRDQVQVLHAGRADALDLALVVELDRPAERHLVGDVGPSNRV